MHGVQWARGRRHRVRSGLAGCAGLSAWVSGYRHSGGPSVTIKITDGPLAGQTWRQFPPCGTLRSLVASMLREIKISVYTEVVGNHPMHDNVG